MEQLQVFNFNESKVRTVVMCDEPWFVLKDVCGVLGIKNTTMVAGRLDEDEVTKFNLGGLSGESNIVNESGLYKTIFQSKKAEAKKFTRWVTSEVLPTIRKTGRYEQPTDPMTALKLMFDATSQTNEKVAVIDHRVTELEENAPLNPGEYNLLNTKVSERIRTIKRERRMELTKQQNSEMFKAINREIKAITGVHTRSQLRQRHLDGVLEFILDWEPSKATLVVISQTVADI